MTLLAALAAGAAVLVALLPGRRWWSPVHRPGRLPPERLRTLGRLVRTAFGRPPDPVAERRLGIGMAVAAAVVLVDVVLPLIVLAAAFLSHRWRRARRLRAASDDDRLVDALPDVIDLFVLAVGAGRTIREAIGVVARWAPPVARPGLEATDCAIDRGVLVVDALTDLRDRWGDPARPLVRALTDHARHGTPLMPPLERLGAEARHDRRRAAETRARRLPVLLLFPLVFCTLPAFGLLTVAPIVAGALRSLDGERLETPVSTSNNESENS